jgi:hypothetical protein
MINKFNEYKYSLFIIFFAFLVQFQLGTQESLFNAKFILNKSLYATDNPFLLNILNTDFSLLHFFSFWLAKSIDYNFANFVLNYLLTIVSFFSIYYCSYLVTKDKISSVLTTIFLISYNFINTRYYGIEYPTGFYTFGQAGMYFAFLSCGLYLNNKKKLFSLVLVSLFFIHAAWFLFCLYFLLIKKIIDKDDNLINFKIFFFSLIIIISFIVVIYNIYLKPIGFEVNFFDTTQTKVHLDYKKLDEGKVNVFFETHKPYFFYDDKFQILNLLRFLIYDFLFVLTFFLFRRKISKEILFIFKVFLILILLSYIYLISDRFLSNILPNYLIAFTDRLILTRYLNLINIFLICFYVATFFRYLIRNKVNNTVPILFFCVFIFINIFGHEKNFNEYFNYGKYISFYNLLIYLIIFYTIFLNINFRKNHSSIKINNYIVLLIFFNICWYNLNTTVKFLNENKIITKSLESIKTKKKIIFGGKVFGLLDLFYFNKYNEIIFVLNPRFHQYSKKEYSELFCNKQGLTFKDQSKYFDYLNSDCLNKNKDTWDQLSKKMDIGYLILPSHIHSNLEMLSKSTKFKIYKTTNDLSETK